MAETAARSNGFRWPRTGLPVRLLLVGVVLALVIVSGLIFLLYEETRGPGEILREFAQAVDRGDCEGSYALLDESVHRRIADDAWCDERLPQVDEQIDAGFQLEQAILRGDLAVVHISGSGIDTWTLRRHGERSWRVFGPGENGSFEGRAP
jgi:hypothetical protein